MTYKQCDIKQIIIKSALRAAIVDMPIAVGYTLTQAKYQDTPKILAAGVTVTGAFASYMIRGISKECLAYYLGEEYPYFYKDYSYLCKASPYLGAFIGGGIYFSMIDGVKLDSILIGGAHQLAYELNMEFNPLSDTLKSNLVSGEIIEIGRSTMEGETIVTGVVTGLYVGFSLTASDLLYEWYVESNNTVEQTYTNTLNFTDI